jgi:hypothetical protein
MAFRAKFPAAARVARDLLGGTLAHGDDDADIGLFMATGLS